MTVAREFIAALEAFAGLAPPPRVKALHLPAVGPDQGNRGAFCGVELADGSLGLSYALLDDTLAALAASRLAASLPGADPLAVARLYGGGDGVGRTVGLAAINALTRCCFDRAGYLPAASRDSLGELMPAPGDHVGMIGFFAPLVPRLVAAGARLTVVELKAELAGQGAGYRVTLDRNELATCNKVLATSTVLLNDTLEAMLAACPAAGWFTLVGPGAGCLPDPLFARGVTLLGGNWAVDGRGLIDALECGAPWSGFARKVSIGRAGYPGWTALLERLR